MTCEEVVSALLDFIEYELFEREPKPNTLQDVEYRWRLASASIRQNIIERIRSRLLV
ncbi:MAG: hypothetical protein F7C36_00340 [Desulfurococcales archaeon]|nr:hypothetical protein [Desulfurococcales archaeon]